MNSEEPKYWIGKFDNGEIVIFDSDLQKSNDKDWVYLWIYSTSTVDRYLKHMARKAIRKAQEDARITNILNAYVASRRLQKEKVQAELAQRASEEAERQAKRAAELAERHRRRQEMLGLPWRGLRASAGKDLRVTHCWACKSHLDNSVDVECITCGWILCLCGACGCGRDQ
jgi:hypothetical protein